MIYKIAFYVPESHCDAVKDALFLAGAGRIGNYSHCAWQTRGTGQFKPNQGSQPHLGERNELCTVIEYKVELVCDAKNLKSALNALLKSHPYEEPAYEAYQILKLDDL